MRVGFVTTHPIQYHAGWFRTIAEGDAVDLDVLYCHNPGPAEQASAGFGVPFSWDVPLFDGYKYRFLHNVAIEPATGRFGGLDTPGLKNLFRSERYDAVVVNGWHYKSAWQAIRACWGLKVPVLVRSDSHLHTTRHPLKRLLKALPYRWFISRLDACLPVGQWSSDYFLQYGARPERIFVVPHAIDASFGLDAANLAPERDEYRRRWGLRLEQTVFLFAGKFIDKKRPLDFVRAIERAGTRNEAVAGLMVGDGPLRRECEALVRELRLPVTFAGFLNQSEMVPAYLAADALVLPSNAEETWGLVVNEAMTCGRPCIVSDLVGCGPDLVEGGETGFIFPLGNVDVLGTLMADSAKRTGHLARMGQRARARIADYSGVAAARRLTTALSQVVA